MEAKPFDRTSKHGPIGGEAKSGAGSPQLPSRERKALTIGAVCRQLQKEFPDISISKIRYLEDQQLLAPRRTQGGYRLYSPADVSRLRTILRLQRDEFLPLRVIRQELASGRADEGSADHDDRPRNLSLSGESGPSIDGQQLMEQTGVEPGLLKELDEFGLVRGAHGNGKDSYDEFDQEIVKAVAELTRYGVAGRNLRVFRTSAEREAVLLEQILGAALRSPNQERRRETVESLESLASVVSRLQHLLLLRDLRRLVG